MRFVEILPSINAALNLMSAVLLLCGFAAVRRRQVFRHRRFMLAAVAASMLFLAGYVTRVALAGTHRFPVGGTVRQVYLAILGSHMLLALVLVPLLARTLYLGLRRFDRSHRRLARFTWPLWLYVSLTGVAVYVLLYHVGPWLAVAAP